MRSEKQLAIFLVVIVVVLLIGGGIMLYYQKTRYSDVFFEYNGFDVQKVESNRGIPVYQIKFFLGDNEQPFLVSSRYNPLDLEGEDIEEGVREKIVKKKLFVTMDPNLNSIATLAYSEIDRITENPFLFNLPTNPGLLEEVDGNDLPVISCNDVDEDTSVIRFDIGEVNKVYSEGDCIIVEGISEEDLLRLSNALSLKMLGILK